MQPKIIHPISIILLSFNVLYIFAQPQKLYKLNLIDQSGGASCLDGSAPGYYIHEGIGQNKTNYILYFQGGGFCGEPTLSETLDSCYNRSLTKLGSTKNAPETLDGKGYGILSPYQSQNQLFFDWTRIVVIYCDGSEYSGHRQNPIPYKGKNLYFRGSRNVKSLFSQLDKRYKIYDGGKIIITGVSAGGIASFQWSNYLVEHTRKAKVYAMPDSGLFITDYYSPIVGMKKLREDCTILLNLIYNKTEMPEPIQNCVQQQGFDIVDCFNAGNYAKYLKAPIFMIQSAYDQWCIKYILGASCLTNPRAPFSIQSCNQSVRNAIEDYRKKSIQNANYVKNNRKNIGSWGPACVQHGFESYASYNNSNYMVNGTTLMQAIQKFLNNQNNAEWLMEENRWPNNQGCNGLQNSNQLRLDILSD